MIVLDFIRDFLTPKRVFYIEDETTFDLILKDIESHSLIAIDTEFIWKNTYFPKLSLIQISTPNKIYILDCFKLKICKIKNIFADNNTTKIFHSVRGDSSVLYNCLGIKIKNIFDTQIAEEVLNSKNQNQISYKKLVKKYFYKDISKSETNSNWEKRPLRKEQLDYAAEDVRFLHSIMKMQNKKLESSNKKQFFYKLCEQEKNSGEIDFSKSRLNRLIKKNKNISDIEIKIFKWREEQAQNIDIPPSHIIKDKDLKRLKKVLLKKNFDECRWIIKKDSLREDFLFNFS